MFKSVSSVFVCLVLFSAHAFSLSPVFGSIQWTEKGDRACVVSDVNEITVINSSGEKVGTISLEGILLEYSLSPNGERIAYATMYGGAWIARIDGTYKQQVTDKEVNAVSWTPDGEKVIFTTVTGEPEQREFVVHYMDVTRKNVKRISGNRYDMTRSYERHRKATSDKKQDKAVNISGDN